MSIHPHELLAQLRAMLSAPAQDQQALAELLGDVHAADICEALEQLPQAQALVAFTALDDPTAAEVLEELDHLSDKEVGERLVDPARRKVMVGNREVALARKDSPSCGCWRPETFRSLASLWTFAPRGRARVSLFEKREAQGHESLRQALVDRASQQLFRPPDPVVDRVDMYVEGLSGAEWTGEILQIGERGLTQLPGRSVRSGQGAELVDDESPGAIGVDACEGGEGDFRVDHDRSR